MTERETDRPDPAPAAQAAEQAAGARADLPPAARRALEEAEERRRKTRALDLPPELGGREGPEPIRFGDWERRGIAVDF